VAGIRKWTKSTFGGISQVAFCQIFPNSSGPRRTGFWADGELAQGLHDFYLMNFTNFWRQHLTHANGSDKPSQTELVSAVHNVQIIVSILWIPRICKLHNPEKLNEFFVETAIIGYLSVLGASGEDTKALPGDASEYGFRWGYGNCNSSGRD